MQLTAGFGSACSTSNPSVEEVVLLPVSVVRVFPKETTCGATSGQANTKIKGWIMNDGWATFEMNSDAEERLSEKNQF